MLVDDFKVQSAKIGRPLSVAGLSLLDLKRFIRLGNKKWTVSELSTRLLGVTLLPDQSGGTKVGYNRLFVGRFFVLLCVQVPG